MSDPTGYGCGRACSTPAYCDRCDLLVGLPGLRVTDVHDRGDGGLVVTVESPAGLMGCASCGVVAVGHGRRVHELIDAPSFGRPVRVRWRKRTWLCTGPGCDVKGFTERDSRVAAPRALLTTRACWWAVRQIRRENASVAGVARQLGTTWRTVWSAIKPLLEAMAADPARFDGVTDLGVDEHVWHHVSPSKRGPKELTGTVGCIANVVFLVRDTPLGWGGHTWHQSSNSPATTRHASTARPGSSRCPVTSSPS